MHIANTKDCSTLLRKLLLLIIRNAANIILTFSLHYWTVPIVGQNLISIELVNNWVKKWVFRIPAQT